jgi:tetratricopeptide (TPR) repeat protein
MLVDEVVDAITAVSGAEDGEVTLDLREQMERAAAEFDKRTALTFGRALVDSLCEDPSDVRRLEALLILGLAHPQILEQYKVSLGAEGRRLSVLLENRGEEERARSLLELLAQHSPEDRTIQQDLASMMRRAGEVEELIDRCLKRADDEVRAGRPMEAIPWLQEILLHDQTRRDVARMIRDLRYEEMESSRRRSRRRKIALAAIALSTGLSSLFVREQQIRGEYEALPPMISEDAGALEARLAGIDGLLTENQLWIGMFDVARERSDLQQEVDRLEAQQAERDRQVAQLSLQRQAMAESARLKGIELVNRAQYEEALYQFQRSLELSPPDWDSRERVSANVLAIEELLSKRK